MRAFRTPTHEQLLTGENWACVVCTQRWPAKQMKFQDGIESDRRCPNCYAPNGGELARTISRARASEIAGRITEEYAAPSRFPGWFDDTTDAALITFSPEPRMLTRGGSSAPLTITGTNLSATDSYSYGHAGITNASVAVLTPVTYDSDGNAVTPYVDTLVLTLQVSLAVPIGLYNLTYEGALYRGVLDVR